MLLALLRLQVPNRSTTIDTVLSKPVPGAGAEDGRSSTPEPPTLGSGEPMTDSDVHLAVPISVAAVPEDATEKQLLIERADQALYQAKRSGKNCLVTASSIADLKTL